MALQGSGSISFSQIANEFGTPSGKNLGAYRVSENVGSLSNLPLDAGIPTSGAISFSNFYGKRLNIVVDLHSIPQNSTRRDARNRYDNNRVRVIGGFRSRPSNSSGTKVFINVNKTIGSNKNNRNNVALKTGSWNSGTQLITVVGPSGRLLGAGGNGGDGRRGSNNGDRGTRGTSGFGIQYSTTIVNQGLIFGGRGGGGGGGGGRSKKCSRNQRGCKGGSIIEIRGGGGAGGRGLPAGSGGNGGNNGTSGTTEANGSGGAGITVSGSSAGFTGTSGSGGSIESSGGNGTRDGGRGGAGGNRGYAIIINPGASIIGSITGSGNIGGDIVSGTVS
jgi:hypothetical protein